MMPRLRPVRRLLFLIIVVIVAGVIWWRGTRVPELRQAARFPHSSIGDVTPYGFFLTERPGGKLAYGAQTWAGQLLSRSTPLPLPPDRVVQDFSTRLSPDSHWLVTSLLQKDGLQAAWSLWHDGRIVRTEILPAYPYAEMRDDGTAWLFGSTGATLWVCAMRAGGTYRATDRVPYVTDDVYGFGHPILSCAILPADPVMPSWGGSEGKFTRDGATLTVDAYRRDNIEQSTQMPRFATYRVRIAGGRLLLRRTRVDTGLLALPVDDEPMGKTDSAPAPPAARPGIPPQARIGADTAGEWRIPGWQRLPAKWQRDATPDGRFALVFYSAGPQFTDRLRRLLSRLRHGAGGTLAPADACYYDLYERPGILRGRGRIPLPPGGFPFARLSPDGHAVLVRSGDDVLLLKQGTGRK